MKSAETLARKIEGSGGRALAVKADVSDPKAVREMFDAAEAAFGGVDVLVNNAGIMKLAKIADSDDALFDQQAAVNLKGTFNTLREAAKRLRDGGRIVNFSTSVVGTKLETYGVYTATKAAIETMTAILSKELRGRSITVNAIAPGPTATDLFLVGKSPELIDRFAKMNPLERLGTPADIASAVAFLVACLAPALTRRSPRNGAIWREPRSSLGCGLFLILDNRLADTSITVVHTRVRSMEETVSQARPGEVF